MLHDVFPLGIKLQPLEIISPKAFRCAHFSIDKLTILGLLMYRSPFIPHGTILSSAHEFLNIAHASKIAL
jgi:hypothetical protein